MHRSCHLYRFTNWVLGRRVPHVSFVCSVCACEMRDALRALWFNLHWWVISMEPSNVFCSRAACEHGDLSLYTVKVCLDDFRLKYCSGCCQWAVKYSCSRSRQLEEVLLSCWVHNVHVLFGCSVQRGQLELQCTMCYSSKAHTEHTTVAIFV